MTQNEKALLLKDLCARLPYGVKVLCLRDFNHDWYNLEMVDIGDNEVYVTTYEPYANRYVKIEEVKPYLFPLSSMTEEQKEELFFNYIHNDIYFDDFTDYFLAGELWHGITVSIDVLPELINWLNKHHLDWRGLIPMGLAIDATGLNIY